MGRLSRARIELLRCAHRYESRSGKCAQNVVGSRNEGISTRESSLMIRCVSSMMS